MQVTALMQLTASALLGQGHRLERMEGDISTLKTDVAVLKTDVAVLKTDVSELKADVSELKGQLNRVELAMVNGFNNVNAQFEVIRGFIADREEGKR